MDQRGTLTGCSVCLVLGNEVDGVVRTSGHPVDADEFLKYDLPYVSSSLLSDRFSCEGPSKARLLNRFEAPTG